MSCGKFLLLWSFTECLNLNLNLWKQRVWAFHFFQIQNMRLSPKLDRLSIEQCWQEKSYLQAQLHVSIGSVPWALRYYQCKHTVNPCNVIKPVGISEFFTWVNISPILQKVWQVCVSEVVFTKIGQVSFCKSSSKCRGFSHILDTTLKLCYLQRISGKSCLQSIFCKHTLH